MIRVVFILLLVACPVGAQFKEDTGNNCFNRLEHEVDTDDVIKIYCDTGVIVAVRPRLSESAALLHYTPVGKTKGDDLAIPYNRIDHITYTRPHLLGELLGPIGLMGGAVAGALIGGGSASSSGGYFAEFEQTKNGVVGAVIGGLVGGMIGFAVGGQIRNTVTVTCPDAETSQP